MKPHIYFFQGFWRVTPMPRPYPHHQQKWGAAHLFVLRLNQKNPRWCQ